MTATADLNLVDAFRPDAGSRDVVGTDGCVPRCGGTMHVCLCATGYYCLRIGLGCLAPSAPCPM